MILNKGILVKNIGLGILMSGFVATSVAAPAKPVLGFYASWSPPTVQWTKITHLMFAFIFPGTSGTVTGNAVPSSLVSAAHAAGVKVIASVGGANDFRNFSGVAANASYRANFATSLKTYITTNNIDGVDIDWEYPTGAQDSANFTLLLAAVRNAIGTSKILTVDLPPTGEKGQWISKSALSICDFYNVMAYDFTGAFEGSLVGQHSSYSQAILGVLYWKNRGVPKEKVVLGVPFYGKDFNSGGNGVDYNNIMASNPNLSPDADSVGKTWFNGVTTMTKKATYVALNGYGGIMIWQLGGDVSSGPKSLLDAIQNGLKTVSLFNSRNSKQRTTLSTTLGFEGPSWSIYDLNGRQLSSELSPNRKAYPYAIQLP